MKMKTYRRQVESKIEIWVLALVRIICNYSSLNNAYETHLGISNTGLLIIKAVLSYGLLFQVKAHYKTDVKKWFYYLLEYVS